MPLWRGGQGLINWGLTFIHLKHIFPDNPRFDFEFSIDSEDIFTYNTVLLVVNTR